MKIKDIIDITSDKFDYDFVCECGNRVDDSGFYPCDENGNEIEPTIDSGWNGLYVCADCGRIYKDLG